MSLTIAQIKAAALKLDPADREALAEELLQSISEAQADQIDAAWLAECHRRDSNRASGPTQGKSMDEVLGRLLARGRE